MRFNSTHLRRRDAMLGCGFALLLLAASGCNQQSPFVAQNPPAGTAGQTATAQLEDMKRRMAQLDANNRDLHAQIAQSQQSAKIYQDQVDLLRNRLKQTADQLQTVQVAKEDAEKQVKTLQASATQRGGATLIANNSVKRSLNPINLPGVEVRQDGDTIRIVLPADQLFRTNSAEFQASAQQLLDQVAQGISANYSRNRVAVEGHTDSAPAVQTSGVSNHLLSAQQAMAVVDRLVRYNRLPSSQLFVTAMGSNFPRASNATATGRAANRRVELVIYPEET